MEEEESCIKNSVDADVWSPIIVSLKTSMSLIHVKHDVIKRILHQTYIYKKYDKVLLNIVVLNEIYKEPCFIKWLREEYADIIVIKYVMYDWGNITNIVEAIEYIDDINSSVTRLTSCDPPYPCETRIIYCEDNVVYPKTMVEMLSLVTEVDSDNAIWGSIGFNITNMNVVLQKSHGTNVEVLESYGGIIVRLGTFHDDFLEYLHDLHEGNKKNLFLLSETSDIVISNYLSKHNHPKKIVNMSNKNYAFDCIWSNIQTCSDKTSIMKSRNEVWDNYMDAIYLLAGWKELYLKMITT